MTKEELQAQVDELQKQLDVLSEKVVSCNVFPQKGEEYWTYSKVGVVYSIVATDYRGRLPAYKTEKEAEKASAVAWAKQRVAAAIKTLNNGWEPDFTNKEEEKYIFRVRHETLYIAYWTSYKTQPSYMHMKSKDVAQQIIDEYKEDLLLIFSE